MKVKIFASEYKNKKLGVVSEMESEINDWLAQHPNIKIVDIRQSSNGGSLKVIDTKLFVTIWYEEE